MESIAEFFTMLPSGFYALGGSLVVALFTLVGQWQIQRNENKRALRRLAYEAAMTEWRVRAEKSSNSTTVNSEDLIAFHLSFAWELARTSDTQRGRKHLLGFIRKRLPVKNSGEEPTFTERPDKEGQAANNHSAEKA